MLTLFPHTAQCRWCDHAVTELGWGAALTKLYRHAITAHPDRPRNEPIESDQTRYGQRVLT